jgi:hypothetical protein
VATWIAIAALLLIAVAGISRVSAARLKVLAEQKGNETKRANKETEDAQRERTKALELAKSNATLAENEKSAREKANRNANDALRQTKLAKRNLYNAHMNQAQAAWETNNVGQTLRLLNIYRPAKGAATDLDDFRGFEWYYWDRLCHSELLTMSGPTGHVESYLCSVAFSPDGKRLASASYLVATVKVRETGRGGEALLLKGHSGGIWCVRSTIRCAASRCSNASNSPISTSLCDASP